jgi:hypothetical protein
MSYKKKKLKKSRFDQLKYQLGKIGRALLLRVRVLLQSERGGSMRLPQTVGIMEFLRKQNKLVRPNNKKIDEWVDSYINDCILNGKPVEILTQWCVAKDLEERFKAQGNQFVPVAGEIDLIKVMIPRVVREFSERGIVVNWWVTLNRSFIDTGRISSRVEYLYRAMLEELINQSSAAGNIILLNWEEEVLKGRPTANKDVQNNINKFVAPEAFEIDFVRHSAWVRNDTGVALTDAEIRKDLEFKIGCEAEEGRYLLSSDSPFPNGKFLLASLEQAERYVFFNILAPEFSKRLLAILKPNPWRLNP